MGKDKEEVLLTITESNTWDGRSIIAKAIVVVIERMLARDIGTPGNYVVVGVDEATGDLIEDPDGHARWRREMTEVVRALKAYTEDETYLDMPYEEGQAHEAKIESDTEEAMLWVAIHLGDLWD